MSSINAQADWPELPLAAWIDTRDTLHLWLQIVGKVALVQRPWVNHSWHVALRITSRGSPVSRIKPASVLVHSRTR